VDFQGLMKKGNTSIRYRSSIEKKCLLLFLGITFVLSFILKLSIMKAGSPFITIDDNTAFQGGFMVWFGQAPPQRMYLESWITGLSCLVTYLIKLIHSGQASSLGINFIADAFRDYYGNPDLYVHIYRSFIIIVDMVTAWLIYLISSRVLGRLWRGWAAVLATVFYLFAYNTYWCDIVARPDTITAFFAVLGLYFYYNSDLGRKTNWFLLASIFFGLAAGMKLHAALFPIFIAIDLIRVHGMRRGFEKALMLGMISFFFFCFSAGSIFFDPLTYIKLRRANAIDDASPWISWGEQLIPLFRGTGFLIIPGIIAACWAVFKDRKVDDSIKSVVMLSILWLVLLSSIRQLRAYWMLPALPIFFISAVYGFSCIKWTKLQVTIVIATLLIMVGQSIVQVRHIQSVEFNQLRSWLKDNATDKPFYILGYEAVMLPKNTACIEKRATGLRRILDDSIRQDLPFTTRHLKNWEERSSLLLYDMLDYKYDPGFEYYGFYSTPPDKYKGIIDIKDMEYLLLQEHFPLSSNSEIKRLLEDQYKLVATKIGAGKGGQGLRYKIFKKINEN